VPPPNAQPCDTISRSGGQGVTQTTHYLGPRRGRVTVSYDTKYIPDHIQVFRGTTLIAETPGPAAGTGSFSFPWNPRAGAPGSELTVRVVVTGGHDPRRGTTEWQYQISCPGQ
jgi:hypothetical protein